MKIRVVLLLDSLEVSAWVYKAIRQVIADQKVEIVLAVINTHPISSGAKSPFWYRVYRFLDRKIFLTQPDAFAKRNLSTIPGWKVPELPVQPIQKKYSDYLDSESLAKISSYRPDVIFRFGFRILRGEILQLARLGIWSYHHGDYINYKGGPPCFWEVFNQEETTGVVLQRLNEKLDAGEVLYQSRAQTDPLSVQRNANKVFWLSSMFLARAVRKVYDQGIENFLNQFQRLLVEKQENSVIRKPPSNARMLSLWLGHWTRNLLRKSKEIFQKPYWELTVAEKIEGMPSFQEFKSVEFSKPLLSKGSFYADPFPIVEGENCWLFYEEFDGKSQKGKIGVGLWDGHQLIEQQTVLEEPWHLSYPFVWEEKGDYWMIPESGESGKIYRYRATSFPFSWEKLDVFFPGEGYDPTLVRWGDLYWLFINQKPHAGTSAFIELNAYWSRDLENPDWIPHSQNPIVSDVCSSRPAGKFFEMDGKLYRPAQDSGKRYGHRVKIQEVVTLTESAYSEKTVEVISPDEEKGILGTHTWNKARGWIFSDAFYRK